MSSAPQPDVGALFLRYRDSMYAVAASVLFSAGRSDDADDVVMDVMTGLLGKPPTGPIENWEAYLITATRNRAIDLIRSANVRHHGGELPATEPIDRLDDTYEAVIERVDDHVLGGHLWDLLAHLDQRSRRILWEYKVLGRPRADVAREFGVTPGRISQVSTEALEQLREMFREKGLER